MANPYVPLNSTPDYFATVGTFNQKDEEQGSRLAGAGAASVPRPASACTPGVGSSATDRVIRQARRSETPKRSASTTTARRRRSGVRSFPRPAP